jgi:hypothetical protein
MAVREALPNRRFSETFDMRRGDRRAIFKITVGYYRDGRVGEVFISGAKVGSELEAVARDGAVLLSIALQHGVDLETIRRAITREQNGGPSTIIGAVVDNLLEGKREAASVDPGGQA